MYEVGKLSHLLSPVNGEDRATARSKEDLGARPGADAAPFTPDMHGLVAWLKTQDGSISYDERDPNDCLLCRFGSVVAGRPVDFSGASIALDLNKSFDCIRLQQAAYGDIWGGKNTYAGALARAEKLLASGRTP